MFKIFKNSNSFNANIPIFALPPFKATKADLIACFRILLGRAPQRSEWPIHVDKIGQELRTVVASFTQSEEFTSNNQFLSSPNSVTPSVGLGSMEIIGALATVEDIRACFRLILGRSANPEEWLGHSAQVGSDLSKVVAGYTNSFEFAQREIARSNQQEEICLVQQDGFQIYASKDDAAVGRHVVGGVYEPEVTAIFRKTLRPGMSVIDIGANIGFFAMLSASLVGPLGRVFAFEPNPRNARMLEASRRANSFTHLTLCQVAAGRETGILALNTSHSNGVTSAASDNLQRLLSAETVACVRVDALVEPQTKIDFIKIDVEGAEYNALLGCHRIISTCRPVIVTEFSPEMIRTISGVSGSDYLQWLIGMGYNLATILPDGSTQSLASDVGQIMNDYAVRGTDHIDILATPA